MATHSSILAWRIPMDRGAWRAIVHGIPKSRTQLSDLAQHSTAQAFIVAKQKHVFRKNCKINYLRQREELIN